MLVLSRHKDESIIIDGRIRVTVVDIRGDKIRLGIDAPLDVSVHRQEVHEAILRDNRAIAGQEAGRPIPALRRGRGTGEYRHYRPAAGDLRNPREDA